MLCTLHAHDIELFVFRSVALNLSFDRLYINFNIYLYECS